jgi:hypothetical protein
MFAFDLSFSATFGVSLVEPFREDSRFADHGKLQIAK